MPKKKAKKTITKRNASEQPEPEIKEVVVGTGQERAEASERAKTCAEEVSAVLAKYRCRIMPTIDMGSIEPVGVAGNKIQISATYWFAPEA